MWTFLHRLAHWFSLNRCRPTFPYERDGHWYIASECADCNERANEVHLSSCVCPFAGDE